MRRSRIAQDTAKLFEAAAPRRSTRNSTTSPAIKSEYLDTDDEPSTPSRKRKRTVISTSTIKTEDSPSKLTAAASPQSRKKARRQPAKQHGDADGAVHVSPPPDWETVWNVTAEMRKTQLAPVDTMGCESLAEDTRPPQDRRFQTLVALMLSSQTKDTVTSVAMKNLQQGMPGGFCLQSMLEVDPSVLNAMINKVGFHNRKTLYIKAAAVICQEQHRGDIPDTIEGLVALPGVGPKMAYLCMSAAWGRDEGIGVDVHVHRITNLWGWHKTKNPEETRAALENWLPREKWHAINHLLVGFGQTFCPPVGRHCDACQLSKRGLCPSAVVARVKTAKREVKIEMGEGEIKEEVTVTDAEAEVEKKDRDEEAKRQLPDIEDAV